MRKRVATKVLRWRPCARRKTTYERARRISQRAFHRRMHAIGGFSWRCTCVPCRKRLAEPPIRMRPHFLIVHPAMLEAARRILGSYDE